MNDPNYKEEDYRKDYIRYKILRKTPDTQNSLSSSGFQSMSSNAFKSDDSMKTDNSSDFDFDEDVYESLKFKFY